MHQIQKYFYVCIEKSTIKVGWEGEKLKLNYQKSWPLAKRIEIIIVYCKIYILELYRYNFIEGKVRESEVPIIE